MQAAMEATRPRRGACSGAASDGSDHLLADAPQTARQVSLMLQRMAQDHLSLMGVDQAAGHSMSVGG